MKKTINGIYSAFAALALTFCSAVFILAPTPAAGSEMVPFNGTVSGFVESQSGTECEPSTHVINFGHANQLGAFTGTAEFFPRPCDPDPDLCQNNIPYTGTFDWFAANGDEIYGTFEGYLCPTETPGVYDNHETAEVTGGTGRFWVFHIAKWILRDAIPRAEWEYLDASPFNPPVAS